MPPRIFSLANQTFDVPAAGGLQFGWAELPNDIGVQIAFQQQFLEFFRFLYSNLQSVPEQNPNLAPMQLSLSLRAGALKTYVLAAVSIMEGAIAEMAADRQLGAREVLHRYPFGRLLGVLGDSAPVRQEFDPIWGRLQLLKQYRNFVHLGNAAQNPQAYWQDVLNNEAALLEACDTVIQWLSAKCNGL